MAYKPLTMMRTRGLQGPLFARNANLKANVVHSSGAYFGSGGGSVPVENLIPNSALDGAYGSASNGTWINPVGWGTGFWPPDEATAIADSFSNAVEYLTSGNRGYITQDVTLETGDIINLSCYIDTLLLSSVQRPIHIVGVGITITELDSSNNNCTQTGRRWGVYEVTSGGVGTIRFGTGTTAVGDQEMTVSRPQLTKGAELLRYTPTYTGLNFVTYQGEYVVNNGEVVTHG